MTAKQLNYQAPPALAVAEGATVPNPGIAGVVAWSTTLGKPVYWTGALWTADAASSYPTLQAAVLAATEASSVAALANVAGLALPMVAGGVYQVSAFVTFVSAATGTGLHLGFATPAGCRPMLEVTVPVASAAAATQLRKIFPTATETNVGAVLGTGVTAVASNHTAMVGGLVRNGATAGNFQLTFASEVAGSAVTLQVGSELQLLRVA